MDGFLSRVELHLHFDCSVRLETAWELSKAKGIPLPGNGSLRDLQHALTIHEIKDLVHFLQPFKHLIEPFRGDLAALKRAALEFCEDSYHEGLVYVETRFCPQLYLLPDKVPEVKARDVVKVMLEAFKEGEARYGIKVRAILCCIRHEMKWAPEILRLCQEFRDDGVVAIDIAGDERGALNFEKGEMFDRAEVEAYDEARKLGIHRTTHAGEAGPAQVVHQAVNILHTERIGHGYHVLEDPVIYKECLAKGVHFEACPRSSILTGSVPKSTHKHPIRQFAEDGANFSLNRDCSAIQQIGRLSGEYDAVREWGLNEAHITKANFAAAYASFLPENEKKELVKKMKAAYGIH